MMKQSNFRFVRNEFDLRIKNIMSESIYYRLGGLSGQPIDLGQPIQWQQPIPNTVLFEIMSQIQSSIQNKTLINRPIGRYVAKQPSNNFPTKWCGGRLVCKAVP